MEGVDIDDGDRGERSEGEDERVEATRGGRFVCGAMKREDCISFKEGDKVGSKKWNIV